MSNRGTRGSQSLMDLSEMKRPGGQGRGRGRGGGRGRGQGRGRGHEGPHHKLQPLLEHQFPNPQHPCPPGPAYQGYGGAHGHPHSGPSAGQQYAPPNYPNAPPNYPNAPPNYPIAPPNFPNAPPNYPNAPPNYPNAPPNYPNAPPNYPNAPPNYPNAPGNHPNAPGNYPCGPGSFPNAPGNNYQQTPNRQSLRGSSRPQPASSRPVEKRGSTSTSFLELKDLLQALIQTPHQKLSSKTICSKLKCSEKALDVVCAHNKKLISVSESKNGMDVDLIPNIKICEDYLGSEGCILSEHCGKFHICKAFASGDCPESTKCEFGHVWKTNHNKKLFEEMMMDSFAEPLLKNLMKKVVLRRIGISVCKSYNDGACSTGKQCHALHICQELLEGTGKCEAETCALNHDILEPKCLSLLVVAGIDTNDSKRDVLTKVRKLIQPSDQSSDNKGSKQIDKVVDLNQSEGKAVVSKKLECFQTIEEQEYVVFTVVRSLVSTYNYWNFLDKLQERLEISCIDFLRLLHLYKKTFLVYENGSRILVKLQPKIDLCVHYKSMEKCHAAKNCNFLHLCREFVTGNCNNPKCTRLHKLNASPNDEILKRHFLFNIPSQLVMNYLKTRFWIGPLPYICFPYNDGNCNKKNCPQLHVCYDVLFSLKSCYQEDCDKNHDVMSDHNRKLLSSVADAGDDAIKTALSARVSTIPRISGMPEPSKEFEKKKVPKHKERPPTSIRNSKCGDAAEKPGSKEKNSDQPAAKSSYHLDGGIIVPEICVDHLQDLCRPATNMCPKLHARMTYHWQFSLNGTWHNFAFPHSNHLEKQYRDVTHTSTDLISLSYGRTAQEKLTYSMMNDKGLAVNFDRMELSSSESPTVAVRRIGTPSSAISSSDYATVFGWFFQDKNGVWIEYGNCDSTGVEKHSTTMTSVDIEKAYSTNRFTLQMATGQFTYTLNFQNMTQMNNSTSVVRAVRRRPVHALIEKLKPDDPYGLQRGKNKPASDDTVKSEDTSTGKYPAFWTKMDGQGPKFYSVDQGSAEGSELVRSILLTMPSAEIQGIRRLQNTFHYDFFDNQMSRHKAVTKKPVLNIQRLFHGTREKHVSSISINNFEWRQDYADSGKKFGRGAYFFNNAALAHQFASNLAGEDSSSPVVLAVADVYIGAVALGDPTMVRPPADTTGALTDTTVDNLKVPSIFVKYNNKEYCPHYFINIKV